MYKYFVVNLVMQNAYNKLDFFIYLFFSWQQHCYRANKICKQFWYHHNNYYITMGNGTFKRTFQSHLDPDEIMTESK